jgi:hypothetical protein
MIKDYYSCAANVYGKRVIAAYAETNSFLSLAMTHDGIIWKRESLLNEWKQHDQDLLDLALKGKTTEIEIISKLNRQFQYWNQGRRD